MLDLATIVGALAVLAAWDAWRRYLGRNRADMQRSIEALRDSVDNRASRESVLSLHKRLDEHDTDIRRIDTAVMDAKRVAGNASAAGALSSGRTRIRR